MLRPSWHLVAAADEIAHDGDFVTRDVLGTPVLVRNARGHTRAFVNVCAHRHTLLVSAPRGCARRIRCPYHGWEYDDDGAVCKMPDAACFAPVRRGSDRLSELRVESVGPLRFVCLDAAAPSLEASLGAAPMDFLRDSFAAAPGDPGLRLAVSRVLDHPCNWKIPIENVLESYHVPLLHDGFVARHPRVFRLFEGPARPGLEEHELGPGYSLVRDRLGARSRIYRGLVERLRPGASVAFAVLHAFPNLLLGKTGLVRFAQCVLPTSPTTSRSLVRLFLDLGQADRDLGERLLARIADRVAAALFDSLMRDDARIFPSAQRGMEGSAQRGVLGLNEARIHHFHAHLVARRGVTA